MCDCLPVYLCVFVCVQGDHSPGEHVEWGWRGNQTRFLDAVLYGPDGALYSSLAVQLLTVHCIINTRACTNTFAHAEVHTCARTHTRISLLLSLSEQSVPVQEDWIPTIHTFAR